MGRATILDLGSGDATAYSALGIHGLDSNNMDDNLCLGGAITADCPSGSEYSGCPQAWLLNQPTDGEEALTGGPVDVATELIVVPCAQDLASHVPTTVTLQFTITNELEQQFSASTTVSGWNELALATISPVFTSATLGTPYAQTRITAGDPNPGGILVLAHTLRTAGGGTAATEVNLHVDGERSDTDRLIIPPMP